ncbi:MAG TPA: sucrase ferredoxin [Blastocatellia bacterium]|nr:sucrase ferredoxin [Blastocatellia bacterium]
MNNQSHFFCSELSRDAGEPLYGTASLGQVWLLLEHPSNWGEKALETSQVPDPVKTYLRAALKNIEGGRLLLIRQGREASESINFFIVVARESAPYIRRFQLKSYEDLLELEIPKLAQLPHRPEDPPADAPLYLVCTDGKHDKCCAKYGLRAYQKLRAQFGGSVWESSHVGGDRFAANLVCFPEGLFFGRVSETEAEQVIRDHQNGQIYLSRYRGRSCYPTQVQVGEYFIRLQSGNLKFDGLRSLDDETGEPDQALVRFKSVADQAIHLARFRHKTSPSEIPSSCHSTEKRKVVQYHLLEYTTFHRPTFPLDQPTTGLGMEV